MEQLQNKIDQIKAIVRLYEFCSLKKFHLVDEISLSDHIGKLAIIINNEISANEGLNIFTAKDEKDLAKYEAYLNTYNLNFTRKYFPQSTLGDDFEFLKRVYQVSTDKLKDYRFVIDSMIKPILKDLKITMPHFDEYLYSPDYLDMFEFSHKKRFWFITSKKILHTYKERILIIVLNSMLDKTPLRGKSRIFTTGNPIPNTLAIAGVYLVKKEFYSEITNKPARLLVKIIEKYGIELNFSGKTKKLFIDEFVDIRIHQTYEAIYEHIDSQLRMKVRDHATSGIVSGSGGIIADSVTGYLVDDTKYINDFKAGKI